MYQQQQQQEDRTTTYGTLAERFGAASIHHELGETTKKSSIEWTRNEYNFLFNVILDGSDEDGCLKSYQPSLQLSETLSNGLYEGGHYKPGSSLHTHIKNSNIGKDFIEHVEMYICNCAGLADLEEINVDINNEDQVIEAFLFYYLLQRHDMVNEFVEIRDATILK